MDQPTEPALRAFDASFPADERVIRKKMFGMPAGFVHGHMFVGVWANGLVLRLSEGDRQALAGRPGVGGFSPIDGRPWKDYVLADVDACPADELADWARRALAFTATLPPKEPKAKATKPRTPKA